MQLSQMWREYEWWHFDYADWERYPVLNLTFTELAARESPPNRAPAESSSATPR
jgi:hypothetical protein